MENHVRWVREKSHSSARTWALDILVNIAFFTLTSRVRAVVCSNSRISPQVRRNQLYDISCTDILPHMYVLRGKWYSVTNRLVETKDPEELDPESVSNWKYESIGNMLKDGLYGYDV
jgi:hypothetical protein